MIVHHIIDWEYIHRLILQASSDDALELLRLRLFMMRKHIDNGGLLIVDVGNGSLSELVKAISELRQDGEAQPIPVWGNLSRELEAYKRLYIDSALKVGTDSSENIEGVVSTFNELLHVACLDSLELPGVVLSDNSELPVLPGCARTTIEAYENVFAGVCWRDNETFRPDRERDFDRFLACVSLAASCFGEIVLQDPYLSTAFNILDELPRHCDIKRWRASIKRLLKYCISNPRVESIKFVSEAKTLVAQCCQMNWLKEWLEGRHGRRNGRPLQVAIHFCKKDPQDHDRHVFFGETLPGCLFSGGLDVCNEQGLISQQRVFGVCRLKWDKNDYQGRGQVFHEIMRLQRLPFSDAIQLHGKTLHGKTQFSCDVTDWHYVCKPQSDLNSTFEFIVHPPISRHLTRDGLV